MTLRRQGRANNWHYDFLVNGHRFRGSTRVKSILKAEKIEERLRVSAVISKSYGALSGEVAFGQLLNSIDGLIMPKRFSLSRLLRNAKASAKRRGLEFELTSDELEQMLARTGGCCEISGLPFDGVPPRGTQRPWAASIDRIDGSKGYTYRNCRLVCVIVNYAMNVWGEREVLLMARAIARRQGWIGEPLER